MRAVTWEKTGAVEVRDVDEPRIEEPTDAFRDKEDGCIKVVLQP